MNKKGHILVNMWKFECKTTINRMLISFWSSERKFSSAKRKIQKSFACGTVRSKCLKLHAFFYKQHFYKQRQPEIDQKLSKS